MNYCQFRNDFIKRMAVTSSAPILPPEYQQVEWLQNGGTGRCYIAINEPVYNTYHYFITFEIIDKIGGSIMGSDGTESSDNYPLATVRLYNPDNGLGYIVNKGYDFKTTFSSGVKYTLEFGKNGNTFFAYLNGQPVSGNTAGNNDNLRLCLFFSAWGGYAKPCKIYDVTIKDSYNGNDIYKLIPCYRINDNKPGMYNTVTNIFYEGKVSNSNPGTYILGNNV